MKNVLVIAMTAAVLAALGCDNAPEATDDAATTSTVESDARQATTADTTAGNSNGSPDAAAPAATANPEKRLDVGSKRTAKIGGPVSITYRIVGQPLIGQPLSIDLRVSSSLDDQPVRLDYRILDASALQLAEAQSPFATVAQDAGVEGSARQVTVVPLREGRLYLNVAATVETADGSISTVTAIPIQVGDSSRELRDNGRLETGDGGESVRVLEGSSD